MRDCALPALSVLIFYFLVLSILAAALTAAILLA